MAVPDTAALHTSVLVAEFSVGQRREDRERLSFDLGEQRLASSYRACCPRGPPALLYM